MVLFLVLKKKTFDGQVFSLYIINYSVIRFITEYFRGDHPDKAYLIQGATPFAQPFLSPGLLRPGPRRRGAVSAW